mmetsp:Transcript_15376/g.24335  ORF Transcript_15376/g.24335 Transcript_15376/m.24335 type:complete len:106 (+) Transcript_15376:400-717(+)
MTTVWFEKSNFAEAEFAFELDPRLLIAVFNRRMALPPGFLHIVLTPVGIRAPGRESLQAIPEAKRLPRDFNSDCSAIRWKHGALPSTRIAGSISVLRLCRHLGRI